jgi:diguanylate cyclase (GGDEF)-like protein
LQERLLHALHHAERSGTPGALLCIDLDQFRNVNDTLGHAAGDELLKEAALRLSACVRESDTLARMGGDEFAVVLADAGRPDAVQHLGERVLAAFAAPFTIAGRSHYVTASIGITRFPDDGNEAYRLLRNAELAMYKAKEAGRNRLQPFVDGFDFALSEQLALEEQLRAAVERKQLELHYQPIVALADGRVVGWEALLRWRREDGSLCMPDHFIPTAENMGLITEFGRWVLAVACADLATEPGQARRVAVNVSPRQLQETGFAAFVEAQLQANGLRPEQLELEITERVVMDDSSATEANLKALCALGIRLSIDDFGTGYSALGYLQKYPFNTLKIDRSFVTAALDQANAARLVDTIIAMGHGLGLEVIAEGIETPEQLAFLAAAGCELGQGYHFGRPAPWVPAAARREAVAVAG